MDTWVQVEKLRDGDSVNAETFNTPIDQLASRTEYLKRKLGTLIDEGVQSALILRDVDFDPDEADKIAVGLVVYRADGGFRLAQAKMHLYDSFVAHESAFTLGIVVRVESGRGDVLIYGKMDMGSDALFSPTGMLQSGETFRAGRYYLSATEPGRITANPNGPLIYLGSFHSGDGTAASGAYTLDAVAYINPQFLDIGTSHVHRAYPLVARPAGNVVNGDVVGYYPDGASDSGSSIDSSSSSSGSSDSGKAYPSLVFGGTWTSTNDVSYVFWLEGRAWGSVTLHWTKNGDTLRDYHIGIPAPGVFVDLDNGLKVKVNFPEATSSEAWTSDLSEDERTWTLEMPYAGKGWVNHSVDTIASKDGAVSLGECGSATTAVYASLSGAWPNSDNTVYLMFPSKLYTKEFTDADTKVTLDDNVTYEFLQEGDSASGDNIAVVKAATVEETLHNLAMLVNGDGGRDLLVMGTTLVSTSPSINGGMEMSGGSSGFNVIGGIIPLMVAYDADGYVIGDIVQNAPTYVPIQLDRLRVTVFGTTARATCGAGTVLSATAYDYAPDAIYDYVMGLHQEVDYYFPPVPAQAAGLFVNGVEMENAAIFPNNPTYLIGRKTLYWMEEKEDLRPWPKDITSHDEKVAPEDDKTMVFYFIVGFQCASGPVTSLVPAPGSPIKLYTHGTNDEAYTGDLMIAADLDLGVADAGVKGFNVAKQGRSGKLLAGPVVEKIKGGNGIRVTQAPGCPIGQGTVTIALDDGTMRNHFNEVALENAKQEKLGLFPYISLLGWGSSGNIPSAFTMMMRVPTNLDASIEYQMQLRLTMFGATGYTGDSKRVAGIQMEYNVLPDYTGDTHLSLKTNLVVPASPRIIAVPFGHWNGTRWEYTAYDPFVATTEGDAAAPKSDDVCVPFDTLPIPSAVELPNFKLKPGYLVAIRISRTNPPGSAIGTGLSPYTGPIGFLSMEWTLEEA